MPQADDIRLRDLENHEVMVTLTSNGWDIIRRRIMEHREKHLRFQLIQGGAARHDYNVGYLQGIDGMLAVVEKLREQSKLMKEV